MKRLATYLSLIALMFFASEKALCQSAGPGDGRELHFSISPNPVNGTYVVVNFSEAALKSGQVQLSITNVIGQSLFSHIINQSDIERGSIRIELADLKLSKGLYFVKMASGEHSFTQKLVLR
ncbi:MAG: T9SS type A sorting domain-containing protein [Bacteroidetes bacterium]|nr:T9SS type A sorting domain-containing protein [Bacteroidota bacterium]